MVPVWMPARCLASLAGEGGECRLRRAGWRDRETGPRHPLQKVRCCTHGVALTLYPVGHIPYAREPVLWQSSWGGEDPRASLVSDAVSACRGEHRVEELIEDETGPVRRTQVRRIARVAYVTGLDKPEVDSRILGELGLDAVDVHGSLSRRVAALSRLGPGLGPWLRVLGAMDLVGHLGVVGVLPGVARSRLTRPSGARARHHRGPPFGGGRRHESVLDRGSGGP
jgi:hypothetical protein